MLWGSFGIVHIITILLSCAIIVGLYFALRRAPAKVQTIILGILAFSGWAPIIFNLVTWNTPLEYLPFHLCSLNGLLLPIAVFTRNKVLNNLLLLWSLGAVFAIVINTAQAEFEIFSWTFAFYYFPHTLEVGIPILMFLLKLVKKELKCIFWTLGITFVAFTIIHFINLGLNEYCLQNNLINPSGNLIQVNYMYTLRPENPVLQLFYNLIPHPYWYMLLCVPIVFIYLCLVYHKQIISWIKQRKEKKQTNP